jgi:hypothetical protein
VKVWVEAVVAGPVGSVRSFRRMTREYAMGPAERLLRKTKVTQKSLMRAYSDKDAGRLLVGARIAMGIPFSKFDQYFAEIISEAVEAAAALKL